MVNNPSDMNISRVRDGLQAVVRNLQGDQRDYGGHRVTAIDDLTRAEHELDLALAWDRSHGESGGGGGMNASDRNIESVLDGLNSVSAQLSADQRDYGGHRVAAIDDIHKAMSELQAALQYEKTH